MTVKDHVADGANATLSMGPHGIDIADVLVQPNDEIRPTSEVMMRLINNREPEANFKFPSKQYKDTSEKTGVKLRRCSRVWLNTHDFICYSKSTDDLFCLSCVLYPVSAYRGKRAEKIISSPYRNWKDAKLDLQRHANLQYHRDSKTRMDSFMERMNNPSLIIGNKLSLECQKQVSKNRTFLTSIIKCIELCGRQGLGLRGHRDDSTSEACNQGNFKALLDLRVDAGDSELQHHLETCARTATYISQNEMLLSMKKYIQQVIVEEVKEGGVFFGIEADEVTDTSNWEQLGLVVRYIKNGKSVERLVEFIECESCTGKDICEQIIKSLESLGLESKMCRAQTCDGAENMAGCQNGCAKLFQKISPRAPHFHCASHQLNLVLSHASKVPDIHNMVCTLKSIGIFFKYSPKRQREFEKCILAIEDSQQNKKSESEDVILRKLSDTESDDVDDYYEDIDMEETGSRENEEQTVKDSPRSQAANKKIKPICETRWVERHTAFEDFNDLYEALLLCLSTVAENTGNRKWDAKSKTEAQGLLHQIKSSGFIVARESLPKLLL